MRSGPGPFQLSNMCSSRMAPTQHENELFWLSHPISPGAELCGVGHSWRWMASSFLRGFCATVVLVAGVRTSEKHPVIWGNDTARFMAGKRWHRPDGAGRVWAPGRPRFSAAWGRGSESGQGTAVGSSAALHLLGQRPHYCVTHAQRISLFLTFRVSVIVLSLHLGRRDISSHFHPKGKKKRQTKWWNSSLWRSWLI